MSLLVSSNSKMHVKFFLCSLFHFPPPAFSLYALFWHTTPINNLHTIVNRFSLLFFLGALRIEEAINTVSNCFCHRSTVKIRTRRFVLCNYALNKRAVKNNSQLHRHMKNSDTKKNDKVIVYFWIFSFHIIFRHSTSD